MAEVEVPADAVESERDEISGKDDFDGEKLGLHFQTLRIPLPEDTLSLRDRPGHLRLYGRQSLASNFLQAHGMWREDGRALLSMRRQNSPTGRKIFSSSPD